MSDGRGAGGPPAWSDFVRRIDSLDDLLVSRGSDTVVAGPTVGEEVPVVSVEQRLRLGTLTA